MRFIKIALFALAFVSVSATAGIFNMWKVGAGMGYVEYQIESSEGHVLMLSCEMYSDDVPKHSVMVEPRGKGAWHWETNDIVIVVDGEQFPFPNSIGWRNGDNAWVSAIWALKDATEFQVWLNGTLIDTFKPSKKNIKSMASDMGEMCGIE